MLNKPMIKTSIAVLTLAMLGAFAGAQAADTAPAKKVPPMATAPDAYSQKLDTVLAGSWRSDKNKARDQYRHPKQTLQFFGLKSGMSLIELTPGGGWYSEILAPVQKGSGPYTAAIVTPKKKEGEDAQDKDALSKKFAADPERYSEAKVIQFDSKARISVRPIPPTWW